MAEYYEIVVKGYIDRRWATWFDDLEIDNLPTGEAVFKGSIANESELAAVLDRVGSLGMPVLQVKRRNPKNTPPK